MESRSLKVTVQGILMVSKSTVIPKGTDISSVLAYRRPMDPEESSTFTRKLINCSVQVKIVIHTKKLLYLISDIPCGQCRYQLALWIFSQ